MLTQATRSPHQTQRETRLPPPQLGASGEGCSLLPPSHLPTQEASPAPSSREGERGGRSGLGGCGPRLRELTQGPATAREPPDSPPAWRAQALLPETARIRAHCLCTTRSSREVEPEEEGRGGEGWGEGRPASSPSASLWKLPPRFLTL